MRQVDDFSHTDTPCRVHNWRRLGHEEVFSIDDPAVIPAMRKLARVDETELRMKSVVWCQIRGNSGRPVSDLCRPRAPETGTREIYVMTRFNTQICPSYFLLRPAAKFVTTVTDWLTCCTIRLRRIFFPSWLASKKKNGDDQFVTSI